MAKKKGKTEGVLARELRLKAEAEAIAAAKAAAEEAERKRIEASIVRPKEPRPKKVKRPRFVRPPSEKKPEKKAIPELARSSTMGAKIMTKNVAVLPKEEPLNAPIPKGPRM